MDWFILEEAPENHGNPRPSRRDNFRGGEPPVGSRGNISAWLFEPEQGRHVYTARMSKSRTFGNIFRPLHDCRGGQVPRYL